MVGVRGESASVAPPQRLRAVRRAHAQPRPARRYRTSRALSVRTSETAVVRPAS